MLRAAEARVVYDKCVILGNTGVFILHKEAKRTALLATEWARTCSETKAGSPLDIKGGCLYEPIDWKREINRARTIARFRNAAAI